MSDFDPGEGWRLTDNIAAAELIQYDGDQSITRMWVREAAVPPLPTEPYTVIRVHGSRFGPAGTVLMRQHDGSWTWGSLAWGPGEYLKCDSFEVLAEPINSQEAIKRVADRAFRDGAEAVLEQIAAEPWAREIDLTKWAEMFGVTE